MKPPKASTIRRALVGARDRVRGFAIAGFLPLAMAVVSFVAMVDLASAQATGSMRGSITSESGRPLVGAQVSIPGTGVGGLTNNTGQFLLLNVPAGEQTVRVETLGYGTREQQVTVTAGQTLNVEMRLGETAISLDALVVTGTAGGQQTRSIGNVVGRLSAADVQQVTPVTNTSDMLSANVPGVRIMSTGGEVGSGGIQRIRGVSSVSLSAAPLVYVDGVRVSGGNSVPGVGTVAFTDGAPSPLNDIQPEDIESIEVIKGPAAATLYGTEASNGVINVITKRGSTGDPTINLRMRQGAYWLSDPVNYFPPTYYRCTGVSQTVDVDPSLQCNAGEIVEVSVLQVDRDIYGNNWFRTGQMPALGADVSGGVGTLRYYFSADWDREQGYVSWNSRDRTTARANLSYNPTDQLSFDFSLGTVRSTAQTASPQQAITTSMLWGCPSPGCEPGSGTSSALDGPFRGYLGYLPERFADGDVQGHQDVDRNTMGLTVTHNPTEWLTHRLVFGGDFSSLRDTRLFRAGGKLGMSNSDGQRDVGSTRSTYMSVDYGGSGTWDATSALSLTTSVGAQFYRRVHEASLARGESFPLELLETVSSGGTRTAEEDFWENRSLGMYVQQEIGWQNRLFLTGAVRGDDNSAFGENFSFIVYPKLSASWVASEEALLSDLSWLTTLRLRGAWGRAGTQPDVFDAVRTYEPVDGYEGSAALAPDNVGNPDLKPEVGDEIELGFDLGLFNDRLSGEFTYFRQRTIDALIRVPTLPSLGFPGFQFQNLGETRNSGIEIGLNAQAYRGSDFNVDVAFTLASSKNEVIDLGSQDFIIQNVTEGQYQVPGFPIGGIFAKRVVSADIVEGTPNSTANRMCESGMLVPGTEFSAGGGAAVPCEDAPLVYWGQPLPVWSGSASTTVTLFQNITVHGLVDFIQGRTWINGDIRSAHHSFFQTRAAVERTDPILTSYLNMGQDGRPQPGIMSGDFAKLRTVSVQARLPTGWAERLGASRLTLTAAADNLAILWMGDTERFGHPSIDPERGTQGGGQTPGINAVHQEAWPTGKRFTTTLRVTF
ncbi:MAG: SusC/RagA family TonB-linked outer membrane protein [Dehalococcoidia bacterium]